MTTTKSKSKISMTFRQLESSLLNVPISKRAISPLISQPISPPISAPTPSRVFMVSLLALSMAFIFSCPEAFAVDADGEMGASTRRIDALLNGNIMHVVMGVGIAASVIFSFYKSSFVPVGVGIGAGVLYGFARTWINAVFAMCI